MVYLRVELTFITTAYVRNLCYLSKQDLPSFDYKDEITGYEMSTIVQGMGMPSALPNFSLFLLRRDI